MSTKGIEYKRFVSKEGIHFIAMDLEAYVRESIAHHTYAENEEDYQVICPYCATAYKHDASYHGQPYLKYKLYVGKNLEYGRCFRCNQRFVGISDKLRFDIPHITAPNLSLDWNLEILNGPYWDLGKFYEFKEEDELGLKYLVEKRHYHMKKLYKVLKIRFDQDHNPVIPYFYHGELIYYQIKNAYGIGGKSYPPYFNPPIDHKPAYIIEHGDNTKFVISEGTFDCIADLIMYPNRTPFGVMGSSITDYQIGMLRSYVPDDIIVYMDETSISEKIANRIARYIDYADIRVIPSNGQDPEEKLKEIISNQVEDEHY